MLALTWYGGQCFSFPPMVYACRYECVVFQHYDTFEQTLVEDNEIVQFLCFPRVATWTAPLNISQPLLSDPKSALNTLY